jgi:hypothetical protein
MANWAAFEAAEPSLAARVKERFAIRKHKTLATLRKDGSPRISGIEADLGDAEITLGMMPGSVKLRDLERDPRVALHSPTEDPPEGAPGRWRGEAKITARGRDRLPRLARRGGTPLPPGHHRDRADSPERGR